MENNLTAITVVSDVTSCQIVRVSENGALNTIIMIEKMRCLYKIHRARRLKRWSGLGVDKGSFLDSSLPQAQTWPRQT